MHKYVLLLFAPREMDSPKYARSLNMPSMFKKRVKYRLMYSTEVNVNILDHPICYFLIYSIFFLIIRKYYCLGKSSQASNLRPVFPFVLDFLI